MKRRRMGALVLLVLPFVALSAGLELAKPFSDHMVLQRDRPVPVWGSAPAGAEVAVVFAGRSASAKADASGHWKVVLAPLSASSEGRDLAVTATLGAQRSTVELHDVVVGEVWLCSGQSNMAMSMTQGWTRYGDGIGMMVAQVTDKPMIRYFDSTSKERWNRLTPKFLMTGWKSALPVHYALELQDKLEIPVGVIVAAVGGSNIDSWNPSMGAKAKLHLAHIAPLGPFALRGAVWYQGETNVKEVEEYPDKLEQLHRGWKDQFGDADLPLHVVQLAPYRYKTPEERAALPQFMEGQADYAARHKDASITVINDIGNFEDAHPNNKWLVAKRLALHAFKHNYGFKDIEDESPALESAAVAATNRVRLVFGHAKSLYVYRQDSRYNLDAGFELAGADGAWKKADIVNFPKLDWVQYGVLTNNVVELVAKGVERPVRVRYAYAPPFQGCFYNQVNLPCGPFCADIQKGK